MNLSDLQNWSLGLTQTQEQIVEAISLFMVLIPVVFIMFFLLVKFDRLRASGQKSEVVMITLLFGIVILVGSTLMGGLWLSKSVRGDMAVYQYSKLNSSKYLFDGIQLYKKKETDLNDRIESGVRIYQPEKPLEVVGFVDCGQLSLKECFDKIDASSISVNTNHTIKVSKL